jgi:hypothetical protein
VESALGGMLVIGGAPSGAAGSFAFDPTNERDAVLYLQLGDEPAAVPALTAPTTWLLAALLGSLAAMAMHPARGRG